MSRSSSPLKSQPDPAFRLLRDLVHEKTGLYFDDGKSETVIDKLAPLISENKLESVLDYYYLLKYDPSSSAEWPRIFDALAVQESFFWRETEQIRLLVDRIVPEYFAAHPGDTLHIWSAACAAGQEPLTIAMALLEAGWFDRARIEIHASDASPRAIQAARNGVYRDRSFRRLPQHLREKYFTGEKDFSSVSTDLHSRIHWGLANLMSENDFAEEARISPVIFCRNVFIYFSEGAVQKAVSHLGKRMRRPGHLFLGTAESLLNIPSEFELREIGDAFVYIKT